MEAGLLRRSGRVLPRLPGQASQGPPAAADIGRGGVSRWESHGPPPSRPQTPCCRCAEGAWAAAWSTCGCWRTICGRWWHACPGARRSPTSLSRTPWTWSPPCLLAGARPARSSAEEQGRAYEGLRRGAERVQEGWQADSHTSRSPPTCTRCPPQPGDPARAGGAPCAPRRQPFHPWPGAPEPVLPAALPHSGHAGSAVPRASPRGPRSAAATPLRWGTGI